MKSGTLIAFNSKYKTKHLLTKPLHYVIQLFTGSKFHHKGIICKDWYYEAMGSYGVRKIRLAQKIEEIDDCVFPYFFSPKIILTKEQEDSLERDLDAQVGKQYSAWEAFLSILTAILIFDKDEIKTKKMFCSKLVVYAMRNLYPKKLFDILPRHFNPEEAIKILREHNIIKEGVAL